MEHVGCNIGESEYRVDDANAFLSFNALPAEITTESRGPKHNAMPDEVAVVLTTSVIGTPKSSLTCCLYPSYVCQRMLQGIDATMAGEGRAGAHYILARVQRILDMNIFTQL